jgi:hypothetical protein
MQINLSWYFKILLQKWVHGSGVLINYNNIYFIWAVHYKFVSTQRGENKWDNLLWCAVCKEYRVYGKS